MTYYEIKKVFVRRGSKTALLMMLAVIAAVLYFVISENGYVNENGEEEKGAAAIAKVRELKKEWAGDLTEEKIRRVIEENVRISHTPEALSEDFDQNDIAYSKKQGFMDIRNLLVYSYGSFNDYDYYLPDSLSPDAAGDFYSNRLKNLKEWLDTDAEDQFSEEEKEYLIQTYEALETPLYYDYQAGWKSLFRYAPSILMIVTLLLSFLCAGIFSGEFQQRSGAVFYSSRYGRGKAVAAKIKAGLIIITMVYWGVILLYTGLVLGILGADGANCLIQSDAAGWKSIYNITNWQEYLLVVLGGYLGCVFMLLLTMWVSAKTNSAVTAVIVPFVLIFLPSFLSGTGIPFLNKILGLLPDQLLQMNQVVKYFNLYGIGGRMVKAAPVLLIAYAGFSLLLIPLIYRTYRKKEVY
ncbi:MAG TPA: ABC transporter permease subunit [Candidatus Choladousia intestinipullorum]|nr:ABC transporter permease subunit [Candidatus Choladousia intestinipullorum]